MLKSVFRQPFLLLILYSVYRKLLNVNMMKFRLVLLLILVYGSSNAQHIDLKNNVFGNEWIDYSKEYIKIKVSEDKLYKITYDKLIDAGLPSNVDPSDIRIQNMGLDIPYFSSGFGSVSSDDYVLFLGEKNKAQLDQYLYKNPDTDLLNEEYSIISDTNAYFLSWDNPNSSKINSRQIDYNQPLPETRVYIEKQKRVFSDFIYKPVQNTQNLRFSSFVPVEGFGSGLKGKHSITFDVNDRINIGRKPRLSYHFGTNRNSFKASIKVNGNVFESFDQLAVKNYAVKRDTFIDYSIISNELNIELEGQSPTTINLATIHFEYTRTADANTSDLSAVFTIPASANDQYFKIKNYTGEALEVLNLSTNELYNTTIVNNNLVIYVPSSMEDQSFLLINDVESSEYIELKSFMDYGQEDYDYILLSSSKLNNNHGGSNPIEEYANYRQSLVGGSYDPLIVNVEDLYDQFAFGVDRHFLAIRHFSYYVNHKWDNVKGLFILGKSRQYSGYRTQDQIEDEINQSFFVPTYGVPGADNLLVAGVDQPTLIFPIGRLAATNKADVFNYLDKIKSHDYQKDNPQNIADKLWTKKILHLSGGKKTDQQLIRQYIDSMKVVIEDSKMGADVTTFYKYSSDPITVAFSESLKQLINEGLNLITFFGHSAPGVLDFSLGDVKDYDNAGKYPLMFALGCSAGNIHQVSDEGVSEEFVITKEKGGIAFLASSSAAYAGQQYNYGLQLYDVLGNKNYGLPIGASINEIIDNIKSDRSEGNLTFMEQLTLHGDPAIELYSHSSPDFTPDGSTATTIPQNVNSYESTFEFCVDIVNLGASTLDSMNVNIQHLNSQDDIILDSIIRIETPFYKEKYCFVLPINEDITVGENKIQFTTDQDNEIDELPNPDGELNNRLVVNSDEGYSFYVLNNSAKPIYPVEFGITDNSRPILRASTYNAFDQATDYIIQIDTSGTFDSPKMVEQTLINQRASIAWETPFQLENNTVYYWRISPDDQDTVWSESSFLYDANIESGWNQSHYHQLEDNTLHNLMYDVDKRSLNFARNFQDIKIENRVWISSTERPFYYINGDNKNVMNTTAISPGVAITIISKEGKIIWTPWPDKPFGTFNNRNKPMISWLFKDLTNVETRQNIIAFLESLEEGTQIIINTVHKSSSIDFKTEEWASDSINYTFNLYNYLEAQGAEKVRLLESRGGVPYVLAYTKGGSVSNEKIAFSINDEVIVNMQIPGFWNNGIIYSPLIGPARKWNTLEWSTNPEIVTETDTFFVRLKGLNTNNQEVLLRDSITDTSLDLSFIDVDAYPYLKLELFAKDEENQTHPDLLNWKIYYDEIGDLAIINNQDLTFSKDTLQQGEQLMIKIPIENYSNASFENVNVQLEIRNKNNEKNTVSKKIEGLFNSGEAKTIAFEYDTQELYGDHSATVIVNPEHNPLEKYYFNNFGNYPFHVFREKINPILDVTFDGIHILDNDIISPNPTIEIALSDENPYLLIDDIEQFDVNLIHPSGEKEEILSSDPRLEFEPASDGQNNKGVLRFRPELEDGIYTLMANSKDASGNISGKYAYEVSFEVISKSTISDVYNYPNPFSTSTEFIFTITGSEIPQNLVIQIMTISGKVVKEIRKDELGSLRIGLNRTSYKWDGKDDFGNNLANGVYLYRMMTKKMDGSAFDKFELPANTKSHFKKGWGKMVIIR